MKQFFKFVLATITGIFLLMGIFFLVILSLVSSSTKKQTVEVQDNSVLTIKLNYELPEKTDDNPFEAFASELTGGDVGSPVGIYEILKSIEHAKTDDRIKGIFLDLTFVGSGYARLTEIREALEDFKKSGKFIYSYAEIYYNQTYYLASVSDSIFLNPKGNMIFNGMSAEITFLKETLAKIGIEMQAIKHGKFKGAVEPFTRDNLSDENRKQIDEYINSVFENYLAAVGKSRKLTTEELKNIANDLKVTNPTSAVEYKMIDALAYRDQVFKTMAEKAGLNKDKKDVEQITLAKYARTLRNESEGDAKKIAIVYANGDIVSGNGQQDEIGSDKFIKALKAAREDENVKAVVLRVNSPGGSALASDVIWREAMLTKKVKPLIVSMGDVAASGGYYISCIADTIVAMPNTITGSIGVFGLYPNAEKLMDKLGVHSEFVTTSDFADFGRIDRPLNAREMEVLTALVEEVYSDFVGRVSEGRSLSTAFIDSVAQGRVWTGTMARKNGLIDVYGGLNKALEIAAFKAGIETYEIASYPKMDNPFASFMASFNGASIKQKLIKEELGENYQVYDRLKKLQGMTGIQAIMPFFIDAY